jgi:hypothetical protein
VLGDASRVNNIRRRRRRRRRRRCLLELTKTNNALYKRLRTCINFFEMYGK